MNNAWSFETRQIHAGQTPDGATNARALPIYQTTSYTFNNTDHAANLFALKEFGNIYTRIMNPTQATVEERIASLEGGVGALLVVQRPGGRDAGAAQRRRGRRPHRVQPEPVRRHLQPVPLHASRSWASRCPSSRTPTTSTPGEPPSSPNTKAFFGETISNPKNDILDIEGVAAVAHEVGVPLIVDNTVATPYLIRPIEWGADIVVHSATKYLGGHGTAIAGVIVDAGTFDFAADPERFPELQHARPQLPRPGLRPDLGVGSALGANLAFILKARVQLLRDLGTAVAPFNAFLIAQGIETLSLRVERHVANAQAVASGWRAATRSSRSPTRACPAARGTSWAASTRPLGTGAVLAFEIKGGARGRPRVRRGPRAAQPRGQHRRRAQPGHPPGLHDALAAVARRSSGPPA